MSQTIDVFVTWADIIHGISDIKQACGCPIWHALSRSLGIKPTKDLRFTHIDVLALNKGRLRLLIELPEEAVDWQESIIDYNAPPLPISFAARIMPALISRKKRKP